MICHVWFATTEPAGVTDRHTTGAAPQAVALRHRTIVKLSSREGSTAARRRPGPARSGTARLRTRPTSVVYRSVFAAETTRPTERIKRLRKNSRDGVGDFFNASVSQVGGRRADVIARPGCRRSARITTVTTSTLKISFRAVTDIPPGYLITGQGLTSESPSFKLGWNRACLMFSMQFYAVRAVQSESVQL